MNIKYIIWSIIAIIALTLAGCTSGPDKFINKRIESEKLLNEVKGDIPQAKAANEATMNAITDALKKSVAAQMKKDCTAVEIDQLVNLETCRVDKLEKIKDKKGKIAEALAARFACHKGSVQPKCQGAIRPLEEKLDEHKIKPLEDKLEQHIAP